MPKFRKEKDALGEKKIPADAYYGVQTLRAIENFPISGFRSRPVLITSIGMIKEAAAQVNIELGTLDRKIGSAIISASREAASGKFNNQFPVDVFQAGAGTSFNMNANEVIANRALELLGFERGKYEIVNPNDHVNMSQSSNDVFPTVIRLSVLRLSQSFFESARLLLKSLLNKSKEFKNIIKSGRTHLQDAVPITLGQEFSGYAAAVEKAVKRLKFSLENMKEIGLGGTAIGTGINTPAGFRNLVVKDLSKLSGIKLKTAGNYFEYIQSTADFSAVSSSLNELAVEITRITNDLRLLSSGPRTGLAEITLPPVQPGSSIMPGKINPSIAEAVNMAAYQVAGNDLAVSMACRAGQLEINVMTPLIAFNLVNSMEILKNAIKIFAEKCIAGITADEERCRKYAHSSVGIATVLNPHLGYQKVAEVVKEAVNTGSTIRDIIIKKKIMSPEEIDIILHPEKMTSPGIKK